MQDAATKNGLPAASAAVHLVDDDPGVRAALGSALVRVGHPVCAHASAEEFLAAYDPLRADCLVLDVALPGMNGLDLLTELARRGDMLPTLVLSANADVERIVTAIQRGAIGFQQKPPDPERFFAHVATMVEAGQKMAAERRSLRQLRHDLTTLTPRETEVYLLLGRGCTAKQVACELSMSIRTAHIHRTNVFRKMHVENAVELAQLAARAAAAGLRPGP